jgi:hypothetical protein
MKIKVMADSIDDGVRQVEDIPANNLHDGDIVVIYIVPLDLEFTYEYKASKRTQRVSV